MKKVIYYGLPLLAASSLQGATLTSLAATGAPSTDGWTVNRTNPGDGGVNGEFAGDSGNNGGGSLAGAGNPAWAIYANTGETTEALFTLAGGALTTNQIVSLDFDNGTIDPAGSVGVTFLNGGQESLAFTIGGADANYLVSDAGGTASSGVAMTVDGLNLAVTLTASGAYSLNAGGTVITGTLNNSQTSIDQVRVFNFNAGAGDGPNVYFNNLSVTAVPEPSSSALLGLAGLSLLLRRRRNA